MDIFQIFSICFIENIWYCTLLPFLNWLWASSNVSSMAGLIFNSIICSKMFTAFYKILLSYKTAFGFHCSLPPLLYIIVLMLLLLFFFSLPYNFISFLTFLNINIFSEGFLSLFLPTTMLFVSYYYSFTQTNLATSSMLCLIAQGFHMPYYLVSIIIFRLEFVHTLFPSLYFLACMLILSHT